MNKKTLGLLKIAYAKVTDIPPVEHAIDLYKNSKSKKRIRNYENHIRNSFLNYKDTTFSQTSFMNVSLGSATDQSYISSFDILGLTTLEDMVCNLQAIDNLNEVSEKTDYRITISESDISKEEALFYAKELHLLVLTRSNSYIVDNGRCNAAFIWFNCTDKPEAYLLRNIAYAKEKADYIVVYGHNPDGSSDPLSMEKMLADLGVDSVILTDGKSIDLGKHVKRIDGKYTASIKSLGEFFNESDCSVIIRHRLIANASGEKPMLNRCYIPLYKENGIIRYFDYNSCLNKPQLLNKYKDIYNNSGSYSDYRNNLTIGKICDIISAELPSQYAYMKNVSVGKITTHWYDSEAGGVLFFNEPYTDKNDVIEKPLKVRLIIVEKAIKKGVAFVFSHVPLSADIPHIVLESPMEAHITLCAWLRSQYSLVTIGITGSIGKTSTKDMLYNVLKEKYDTDRNLRNTNTQVNIGLHIQNFKPWQQMFIQEIGGGRRGGASRHSRMILPAATCVTNIGDAHIGNHGSREALMKNKLGVADGMNNDGILFLNGDDPLLSKAAVDAKVCYYGIHNKNCDYYADNITESNGQLYFDITDGSETVPVVLNVLGEHNALNAVCCFAIAKHFGLTNEEIRRGLENFRTSGVRQNIIDISDIHLFVDCFNASPDSIDSSLSVLDSFDQSCRKIAVIGDVTGAAGLSKSLHENIGDIVKKHHMDLLVCYGKNSKIVYRKASAGGINAFSFTKANDLEKFLKKEIKTGDVVLFKGSSKMKLSQSIDRMFGTMLSEQMYADTVKIRNYSENKVSYRVCPAFATVSGANKPCRNLVPSDKIKGQPVYNIMDSCFRDREDILSVKVNTKLRHIGNQAFMNCCNLSEVVLSPSVKYIGEKAFYGCTHLERILLTNSITHIGKDAFGNCENLIVECWEGSTAARYCKDNNINYTSVK